MSTITKEWLQQKIAGMEATRDEIPFGLDEDDSNTLAALRIALASLEAEIKLSSFIATQESLGVDFEKVLSEDIEELYVPGSSAPPAPVSAPDNSAITQHFDTIALEAAREIMCDVNRRQEFLGGDVQLLSRIQCRIDDACRAAMLQGADGNSSDGWVACSERMPDEGSKVIVFRPRADESNDPPVKTAIYKGGREYYHGFDCYCEPTHWMPLPTAPQQE